jgi:hypothetical protein
MICKHPEGFQDQSPTSQRFNQSFVKELANPGPSNRLSGRF